MYSDKGLKNLCSAVLIDAVNEYRYSLEMGEKGLSKQIENFLVSPTARLYIEFLGVDLTGEEIIEYVRGDVFHGEKRTRNVAKFVSRKRIC